jgi:hypothetical protein
MHLEFRNLDGASFSVPDDSHQMLQELFLE